MCDFVNIVRSAEIFAKFLRRFPITRKAVNKVRDRAFLPILADLGGKSVTYERGLWVEAQRAFKTGNSTEDNFQALKRLCQELRCPWNTCFNLKEHEVHVTIKMMEKKRESPPEKSKIFTIARSDPCRIVTYDENPWYYIDKNSALCALVGNIYDGNFHWQKRYPAFHCPDLTRYYPEFYQCLRPSFQEHYKSTAVFPMTKIWDTSSDQNSAIGFLTFDSPKKNAFSNLPDIYKYKIQYGTGAHAKYVNALNESSGYHLGVTLSQICLFVCSNIDPATGRM